MVFVSHPDLSGHFASWIPAFSYLLARGILTVFGLLSSKKSINYEAIQIPALMDFLGAAVVMPPTRCPYAAIPIQPLEKPLFSHYEGDRAVLEVTDDILARNECPGTELNAVVFAVMGCDSTSTASLVYSEKDIALLAARMRKLRVDTDSQEIHNACKF
ncbi:MAG: LOW QUALITY PROTEIN: hypothetical protein KVP17_001749 [Porospora cf. gigantea B]|uniref:uncharacterized protein n=1 Tax=Porospora cf. gigantea B TaxID=2853592 RepID=UPI003571D5F0|nr:MAG: LOW QUALITY PROTEIN: hypothetical protein KVP17_001749 [Porospora cf. gigantea B]